MKDLHLNLFYSYNRDNELIENNLTRAFIVTLRLLSPDARDALLQALLKEPLQRLGAPEHSYHNVKMALQSNMNREHSQRLPFRYLIAMTSDRVIMSEEVDFEEIVSGIYDSIPDGWIYDPDSDFCFLNEAKVGSNPINEVQVLSHAGIWLGIDAHKLPKHLISLTWIDVIQAVRSLNQTSDGITFNTQEIMLLDELVDFLGLFGYRIFTGISWDNLQQHPDFYLSNYLLSHADWHQFSGLYPAPDFRLYVKN